MNRKTAIRWWTMAGLLTAAVALADYVGVMADEDTGTVALSSLEARIANWSAITGTPTTVAGYGITDGATESWVIDYVVANTTPIDMTNEPAFIGWTNIWHDLITNHLADTTSNPHGITPEMIGAPTGTPLYAESDPLYTGAVTRAGFTVSEGTSNAWDDATQTLSIKTNYIDREADPNWAANSNAVMSHVADTNTNPHGITRAMIGAAYTGDVVYAIAANGITNTPDGDGLIDLGTVGGDNTTTVTGKQIKVGSELTLTPDYGYVIGKRSGVTADNGIALGYRASVTSQNSFVWSDASSDSAFNSRGSNTFSVRAKGGVYIDAPTFEITGAAVFGGGIDMQDSTIEQVYELHVDFIRNEDGTRLLISPYAGALYGSWTIETNLTVGGSLTLGGVEYTNLATGLPLTGGTMQGDLSMGNHDINSVGSINVDRIASRLGRARIDVNMHELIGSWTVSSNLAINGTAFFNDAAVSNLTLAGNVVTLARDIKSRDAVSVGVAGAAFGNSTTAGLAGAAFGDGTTAGDYGAAFGVGTTAGDYGAAFGDGTTAGDYGAAFGYGTTAGNYGAAFGANTEAGDYGAAFGYGTSAGEYGFAAGAETSAGDAGFAAGAAAEGADGSFVFADNSAGGMPFNRTNSPNSFSVRAAGGTYFDTPLFTVTGEVAAARIALGTNAAVSDWPSGSGGNLTATNTPTSGQMLYASGTDNATLYWAAAPEGTGGTGWTNLSITGTGNAITGATAAGDTLTLERGTIEGGGGGNLTATNTPTSGQMLYASGTDNDTLYWGNAPEGGGTGGEAASMVITQMPYLAQALVTGTVVGVYDNANVGFTETLLFGNANSNSFVFEELNAGTVTGLTTLANSTTQGILSATTAGTKITNGCVLRIGGASYGIQALTGGTNVTFLPALNSNTSYAVDSVRGISHTSVALHQGAAGTTNGPFVALPSGNKNWCGISVAPDGTTIYATVYGGSIWKSTDSGATWVDLVAGNKGWTGISVAPDGTTIYATVWNGSIWKSVDAGATWVDLAAGNKFWQGISVAPDGTTIYATVNGGSIWKSTDSGATWVDLAAGNKFWQGISVAPDGTTIYAVVQNGSIWKSTDSGATWVDLATGNKRWNGISVAPDGTTIYATVWNGSIWKSTDAGATWVDLAAGNKLWTGISVAPDGTTIYAVVENGSIWRSEWSAYAPVLGVGHTVATIPMATTTNWRYFNDLYFRDNSDFAGTFYSISWQTNCWSIWSTDSSSWRVVASNDSGVWKWNSNGTFVAQAGLTNNELGTLSYAVQTSVSNRMSRADIDGLNDGTYKSAGGFLAGYSPRTAVTFLNQTTNRPPRVYERRVLVDDLRYEQKMASTNDYNLYLPTTNSPITVVTKKVARTCDVVIKYLKDQP